MVAVHSPDSLIAFTEIFHLFYHLCCRLRNRHLQRISYQDLPVVAVDSERATGVTVASTLAAGAAGANVGGVHKGRAVHGGALSVGDHGNGHRAQLLVGANAST